jgi:hypothetical protein
MLLFLAWMGGAKADGIGFTYAFSHEYETRGGPCAGNGFGQPCTTGDDVVKVDDTPAGTAWVSKVMPSSRMIFIKPSDTKGDSTSNMEPTSITGVFAGYEISSGCRWNGIYISWYLEEFVDIDLSSKSCMLTRSKYIWFIVLPMMFAM